MSKTTTTAETAFSPPVLIQFRGTWRLVATSAGPYKAVLQIDRGFGDDPNESFLDFYQYGKRVELSHDGQQYCDAGIGCYRLRIVEASQPVELLVIETSVPQNRFAPVQ